jgi:hypothetical protein
LLTVGIQRLELLQHFSPQTSFADEEEKLLGKMLDAKLIEPSVSEWASPPVLIKKRDRTVRYAIDYRKLNSVTKNEDDIYKCEDNVSGQASKN